MTGGGTEGADSGGDASSINAGTVDQAVGVPPRHGGGDVTPSDGGSHEERGIRGGGAATPTATLTCPRPQRLETTPACTSG